MCIKSNKTKLITLNNKKHLNYNKLSLALPGYSDFSLLVFVVCPALPDPQNGHVEYSNQQRENGTIATYSCNHLFMVNGNNERECQRNAAWSGSAPTCTSESSM